MNNICVKHTIVIRPLILIHLCTAACLVGELKLVQLFPHTVQKFGTVALKPSKSEGAFEKKKKKHFARKLY